MARRSVFATWCVISLVLVLFLCDFAKSRREKETRRGEKEKEENEDAKGTHFLNKKSRKLLTKFFKRRIKIPKESSLSLASQVSRPNIAPGLFNQEDAFIVDAVIEFPIWLDLHEFAEAMYSKNGSSKPKSLSFVGTERCILYEKLEWVLTLIGFPGRDAHSCMLKFVCETQAIHTFYPDYPISIAFELIHLLFSPSLGIEDPCFEDYIIAESKGKLYGRCDKYDYDCPYISLGGILINNFFPVALSSSKPSSQNEESKMVDHIKRLTKLMRQLL